MVACSIVGYIGPGQVLLLDDTTGEGHLSTFSHDEPCKCLVVQIGD